VDFVSSVITLARAEGFTVTFRDGESKAIGKALKSASERLKVQDKSATMSNNPVPPELIDEAEQSGTYSMDELYELQTGHHRWKIEDLTGQVIDEWSYDRLHTKAGKSQFVNAVDLLEWLQEPAQIRQMDRYEAEADILFMHRHHRSPKAKLAAGALEVIWPGITRLLQQGKLQAIDTYYDWMTRAEVQRRFREFAREHRQQISDFFERGGEYSDDPAFVFYTILRNTMLQVTRKKVRDENGKSVWALRPDVDTLHITYRRVMTALDYRREKREELFQNPVDSTLYYDVSEHQPDSGSGFMPPDNDLPPITPGKWDLSLL
jgi:hypothetical protein